MKIKEKINEEELWDRLKTVNAEFKKIKEAKITLQKCQKLY